MVIKFKVAFGGEITGQEIEIDLCDEAIIAIGRRYFELVSGEVVSIPASELSSCDDMEKTTTSAKLDNMPLISTDYKMTEEEKNAFCDVCED